MFSEVMGGRDNGTAVVLPLHLESRRGEGEQGLNLIFMSPSHSLEIWIPILADGVRQERVPTSFTDASAARNEVSEAAAKQADPPKQKRKANYRKGARKAKYKKPDLDTLPLDEDEQSPLDIKFPESE
jgi:hypothetical protein